jgi:hypothetical protein
MESSTERRDVVTIFGLGEQGTANITAESTALYSHSGNVCS